MENFPITVVLQVLHTFNLSIGIYKGIFYFSLSSRNVFVKVEPNFNGCFFLSISL